MAIRTSMVIILALAIAAFIVPAASADVYTFNIPDMININAMDLGMSFDSISGVQISCSGYAHKGLYLDWNGDLQDSYPRFLIELWNNGGQRSETKNIISSNGNFTDRTFTLDASTNEILKSGKCSIFLDHDEVAYSQVYTVSTHAKLDYYSAQLIVDGTATAVPEPASLAVLACGLAGVIIRRRK